MEKQKHPRYLKQFWKKERTSRCITVPDLKLYYTAIIIKTRWHWHWNNGIVNNGIKLKTQMWIHTHTDTWILTKQPAMHNGKKRKHLQQTVLPCLLYGHWWLAACRRIQTDPSLWPYIKVKSKGIKTSA